MKNLVLILSLLFAVNISNAQWAVLNSGTTSSLTGLYFTSPDTGHVVSATFPNSGQLFSTTNGTTWSQQQSLPDYLFTSFFINKNMGWVAGGNIGAGVIMQTLDGGQTWTTQTNTCEQIMSIYFVNETTGWAVGNDATVGTYFIYNTTNGGLNWNLQKTGSDYVRSVFFRDDSLGWVAGDNGRIFNTTDGGANWTLQNTGVVFHFNSICFVNDTVGWSVGQYGNGGCYKTTNGGLTWVSQAIPTINALTSVSFVSPSTGWAVGYSGTILKTVNGGTTWTLQSSGTTQDLTAVQFVNSNRGYAVGNGGTILKYATSTGIAQITGDSFVSISPNPARELVALSLDATGFANTSCSLMVENYLGAVVHKSSISTYQGRVDLDVSSWQSGVYFVIVSDGSRSVSTKLLKE